MFAQPGAAPILPQVAQAHLGRLLAALYPALPAPAADDRLDVLTQQLDENRRGTTAKLAG